MSRANWTRFAMVFLVFCQMINAWFATVHKVAFLAILLGFVFGALQLLVLEAALHTPPPQPKT